MPSPGTPSFFAYLAQVHRAVAQSDHDVWSVLVPVALVALGLSFFLIGRLPSTLTEDEPNPPAEPLAMV